MKTFIVTFLDFDSFSTDLEHGDSFQCLVLQKISLPQSNMNKNYKIKVYKVTCMLQGNLDTERIIINMKCCTTVSVIKTEDVSPHNLVNWMEVICGSLGIHFQSFAYLFFVFPFPGTNAHDRLNDILMNQTILKDIEMLSSEDHTSCLEGLHSTLNHWYPKMFYFSWIGTICS